MASWILTYNSNSEIFQTNLKSFKKAYSLNGEISLKTKIFSPNERINLILWSWRKDDFFPDAKWIFNAETGKFVLVIGYLTNFNFDESNKNNSDLFTKLGAADEIFLKNLSGSFSILFINSEANHFFVFTDRIASRQVWYSNCGKSSIVSDLPATAALFYPGKLKIDKAGFYSFIATARHVNDRSIFSGIRNLSGGEYLKITEESGTFRSKWFNLQYEPDRNVSSEEWAEQISITIQNSAREIEQAANPNYLFLSGGMDSRLAAASFRELNTLTLTTRPNMNSSISKRVADVLGFDHKLVIRESDWYLRSFKRAALIGSGNYKITHAHFMPIVEKTIWENPGANFLLGDMLENFNKHYFKPDFIDLIKLDINQLIKDFHKIFSYSHKNPEYLKHFFRREFFESSRREWEGELVSRWNMIESVSSEPQDKLDALFRWFDSSHCPTQLMLDCIKPYAGLRNLMYNNEMFEILLRIPHEVKAKGLLHNLVLRQLNPHLLKIANSNFWLPPSTPDVIIRSAKYIRPKIGSLRRKLFKVVSKKPAVITEGSWDVLHQRYKKDPAYIDFIEKTLKRLTQRDDVFNTVFIDQHWKRFLHTDDAQTYEIEMMISIDHLLEACNFYDIVL